MGTWEEHHADLIKNADKFTCVIFLGSAQYDRQEVSSQDAAVEVAKVRLRATGKKVAMVYAVKGELSTHVQNVTL